MMKNILGVLLIAYAFTETIAKCALIHGADAKGNDGYQYRATREEKGKGKIYESSITQEKRGEFIVDLNLPTADTKMVTREIPVWINLVPYQNQNSSATALPPLPSSYLNVKNNMPASIIKKHLELKLGLKCEDEVEIYLSGLPIPPEMVMQDLLKGCGQTKGTSKEKVKVGSSAKDFIMVVNYSLKPSAYVRWCRSCNNR